MKISNNGLNLIKSFESFSPTPYNCPAGKLTIGYGHVILPTGDILSLTEQQATELLAKDCAIAEISINRLIKIELTQNEFDALVSLVFNIGTGNFASSTLLKLLNQGQMMKAADEFTSWIFINKTPSKGLLRRRIAEKELFLRRV